MVGFVYDDKEESLNNSTKVYFGSAERYSEKNMQILPTYTKAAAVLADTNKNSYLDFVFFDMRNFIGVYPGGFSQPNRRITRIDYMGSGCSAKNQSSLSNPNRHRKRRFGDCSPVWR